MERENCVKDDMHLNWIDDSRPEYHYAAIGMSPVQNEHEASLADDLPKDVVFDLMATGGQATVCATSPIEDKRSQSYQSEAELEEAFIKQLERQAYQYLTFSSEEELIANLRAKLEKLNSYSFSDEEWARFFKTNIASANDGIVEKTRRIQDDYIQVLECDDGTSKNIYLIDKRNIHNNHLQVINQYTQAGTYENRYDVTILETDFLWCMWSSNAGALLSKRLSIK